MMLVWFAVGLVIAGLIYSLYQALQARKDSAVFIDTPSRKLIIEEFDEYGVIRVVEEEGFRYLEFGSQVEQSCVLMENPLWLKYDYTRAMLLASLCHEHPETALFLGLGAGSLTEVCLATLPLEDVEVLELRAPLPRIAMDYLGMTDDPRLTIRIGDALELIDSAETADLIYLDMYTDNGPSAGHLAWKFLEKCQDKLNPGGWLIINQWATLDGCHSVQRCFAVCSIATIGRFQSKKVMSSYWYLTVLSSIHRLSGCAAKRRGWRKFSVMTSVICLKICDLPAPSVLRMFYSMRKT